MWNIPRFDPQSLDWQINIPNICVRKQTTEVENAGILRRL
jgi:hypothetical protein